MLAALKTVSDPAVQHEGVWEKAFAFDTDFPAFAGHFPGKPVLPAMLQLRMIRLLLEEAGVPGFPRIKSAKFSSPIEPPARVIVRLTPQGKDWKGQILVGEALAASLVLDFPPTSSVPPEPLA